MICQILDSLAATVTTTAEPRVVAQALEQEPTGLTIASGKYTAFMVVRIVRQTLSKNDILDADPDVRRLLQSN